jgi:imidazole glycerol-phosphate synthase subunit HisH
MITVVDYGMGNLGSISNMLKKLGMPSIISSNPADIAAASKLILPGVGSFDAGMDNLLHSGLLAALNERVLHEGVPTLGICLGMQLMTHRSAEGKRQGLGWVDAEVVKFRPTDPALKVPHMGWNGVKHMRTDPLTNGLPDEPRFYFVHSYYVQCHDPKDVLLTTSYGQEFHSAFRHDNVWGVQFHPEKSHKFGMNLLRNFAEWLT